MLQVLHEIRKSTCNFWQPFMASVTFCPVIFKQPERAQQYDEDLHEIMKFDDQLWNLK